VSVPGEPMSMLMLLWARSVAAGSTSINLVEALTTVTHDIIPGVLNIQVNSGITVDYCCC
jgi:hypothetical protein